MSIWDQRANDNSGVEVYYTGKNLYRLTGSDGSYDAKIEAKSDGSTHIYETSNGWVDDHSHDVYDRYGNHVYSRGEGYHHKWKTRDDD